MRLIKLLAGAILALAMILPAAAGAADEERDTSKPTNLFSRLDTNLEWTDQGNGTELYGYRGTFNWAINSDNLALFEVPLLNNSTTNTFGLGDIRARFFTIPVRRPDEVINAFGASVDIFAPTGEFKDGLGSSSWVVAPGVMMGMAFANGVGAFPIVSYQYVSKPDTDLIPEASKKEKHGMSVQSIVSFPLGDAGFLQLTPKYTIPDFDDDASNSFSLEAFSAYPLGGAYEFGVFASRDFEVESTTLRVVLSRFL